MPVTLGRPNTALVLMKFDGDPWSDKRYGVIADVLEEAGYRPLRADEVRTSGPVVDELWALIKTAPLLVLDSSGDSHSVSYELGYAHGCQRDYSSIVHLRSTDASDLPFNFRHFRAHLYRNLRHLRRLLRDRLDLTIPLRPTDLGFALSIDRGDYRGIYGEVVAGAVLDALKKLKFSGRCEYYAGEPLLPGAMTMYLVGLGCKFKGRRSKTPDPRWWRGLLQGVAASLQSSGEGMFVDELLSELGEMSGFHRNPAYQARGVCEFDEGRPSAILSPDSSASDSWFIGVTRERIGAG